MNLRRILTVVVFTLMAFQSQATHLLGGEIIWESHDISAKWDGTFKNKTVQNGTYTWQVEYTRLSDGKKIFETGHLNVIR